MLIHKPTVRIVHDDDDSDTSKENRNPRTANTSDTLKPASASKPGSGSESQDQIVSDTDYITNEEKKLEIPPAVTLLPKTSLYPVPKTAWHRRSGSAGTYNSDADTLAYPAPSSRSDRFSEGTTLRGTPTPYESEHPEQVEERAGPAQALETLQETSPERSTIRQVPPSIKSAPSESSLARPNTAPPSSSDEESPPDIPRKSSRRKSSASSIPAPLNIRKVSESPVPRPQESQGSITQSEVTVPALTSPNIIAYHPPSPHRRSASSPLHYATSIESIQSRLQYPSTYRPETGRSLATSSSWASFQPSSSTDTLPPLQVPKKRLRHKQGSQSLSSQVGQPSQAGSSRMDDEEIDTLPYPRQHFSSHLSTIASESDRAWSQQLSHFSFGSGVLTGDDSSSIPLSGTWPRRRRESAPVSTASESPPAGTGSSEDEAGDMTLGLFRAESAKPEPLAVARGRANAPHLDADSKHYDGERPPVPPIPKSRDSDERFDTVSELTSPSLKHKKSGYTIRQRSNSTPSQSHSRHNSQISYDESERWSHGSSIFPTWAKNFYTGTVGLVSASKLSLNATEPPRQARANTHARNDSQWTERSITSRLGTGYSTLETGSPTSSHFLPSIFRPRTRPRARSEEATRHSKHRLTRRSRRSGEEDSRPDSLAIFNDSLPASRNGETLPSGQPKWGQLREGQPPLPPLPRKYSKQKIWDTMEYPRPMTQDRLSGLEVFAPPHLAPSKRVSNRMSAWKAPSFVESLDTLVRSRGNRQIALFALGFVFPLLWMLGAVLPLPPKPASAKDVEKSLGASEEDVQAAMMKHEAGDAERRWREERLWLKARWWRCLNRIMSVVGVLVIGAVVSFWLDV